MQKQNLKHVVKRFRLTSDLNEVQYSESETDFYFEPNFFKDLRRELQTGNEIVILTLPNRNANTLLDCFEQLIKD